MTTEQGKFFTVKVKFEETTEKGGTKLKTEYKIVRADSTTEATEKVYKLFDNTMLIFEVTDVNSMKANEYVN
jgi:ribosomal protein L20A (L18A)